MTKGAIKKIEELLETMMTAKSMNRVKARPASTNQITGVAPAVVTTPPKKDYDSREKSKYTKSRY